MGKIRGLFVLTTTLASVGLGCAKAEDTATTTGTTDTTVTTDTGGGTGVIDSVTPTDAGTTGDPGTPPVDAGADPGTPPLDTGTDLGTPDTSTPDTNTPKCSAETPVCDPGCTVAQACTFANNACTCTTKCDSTAPKCAGTGPNNGCAVGEFCGKYCTCEKVSCIPEDPVCDPACGIGTKCNSKCACEATVVPPKDLLLRPSRSTAVDISPNDATVAMVNSDDGTVSLFDATPTAEKLRGKVQTSATAASEPVAVVIHPDGKRAFVANRATGTVGRISAIDSTPAFDKEVAVGAEPVGLALSPTGTSLYVTDWVNGTLTQVATADLTVTKVIALGGNPYAIAITNDGDQDDTDERAFITQFFGRPEGKEGVDNGRKGVVQVVSLKDGTKLNEEVLLAPLTDCFTNKVNDVDFTSGCYPNQLHGIALHTAFGKTRGYVVSVAASPAGPINFSHNVQALLSVFDADTLKEETTRTANLNTLVKGQADTDGDDAIGRRFLNTINAIDFVPTNAAIIGYVTAAGSDIVLRFTYEESGALAIGSGINFNIPVGQNPQGLVVRHSSPNGAYVANLISRDLSVVNFKDQATKATVLSTAQPGPGSEQFAAWKGKRFFNTSTAIWSKEGWGSCQGCHFQGLTDNVTFMFGAGPRQSVSLDGQYASKDPTDMRALNWTAIFDETHDFENNTRGVSGGKGAIQNATGPINSGAGKPPFSAILVEDGSTIENHQANNGSMKFVANSVAICTNDKTCPDWNQVDEYIKTIRSPRGKQADAALITKGRSVFDDGGCAKCHGGAKWTVSRVFYDPKQFSGTLPKRLFAVNAALTANKDATKLKTLPVGVNKDATIVAVDDSDAGTPALKRIACVIRDVGTFGATGGAEEKRDNGTAAQGKNGYNPPSLLGLSLGAPYLHNGAAKTLDELFSATFSKHTVAGNPNFILSDTDRTALIAFLLSIDETTTPFTIDADWVLCPTTFAP